MNRFDTQARLVFYYAHEEATALNQSRLVPGHLLLGLMHSDGGARNVLEGLGAQLGSMRTLYHHLNPLKDHVQPARQAAFSPQIRRVIGRAAGVAQALGAGITSSQHILLALLKVRDPVLRQMLNSIAPDQQQLRTRALELDVIMEQVALEPVPDLLPERTRATLARLLTLTEEGGNAPARSMMVTLLLKKGDRSMVPWLESVMYRWLTGDQVTNEEKHSVLHLLLFEALPRRPRLSAG